MSERLRVDISPTESVTAIVYAAPVDTGSTLILAHGAGGNQQNPLLVRFARGLAARGVETITFNFLYTEQRRRLPDKNDKLEACYRQVIEAVRSRERRRSRPSQGPLQERLAIGGKSMGGRIASQVAAAGHDGIDGIVALGYPLHPPGRPDKLRTKHLSAIGVPMLIVQGSRDAFGTPDELEPFVGTMRPPVELRVVEGGDHSFKVAKSAPVTQEQVYDFVLDTVAQWMRLIPHRDP
jgi:predicted alpha/beta-hydrolase family hydrolase